MVTVREESAFVSDARVLGTVVASNGDVCVKIIPWAESDRFLMNAQGQPNPDNTMEAWIDVPSKWQGAWIRATRALYARQVQLWGQWVDRSGRSALYPLDAICGPLEEEQYGLWANWKIHDLEVAVEDQLGGHFNAKEYFAVYSVVASYDDSDFTHPPNDGKPRRVRFNLPVPGRPFPVEKWKAEFLLDERSIQIDVKLEPRIETIGPGKAHVVVEFVLKPGAVLISDIAVFWSPSVG